MNILLLLCIYIMTAQAIINFYLLSIHKEFWVIKESKILDFDNYKDKKRLRAAIHESGHAVCLSKDSHFFDSIELDTETIMNKKFSTGSGLLLFHNKKDSDILDNSIAILGGLASELEYLGNFYSSSSKKDLNYVKDLIKNAKKLPDISFTQNEQSKFDIVSCYKDGTFNEVQKNFLRKAYSLSKFRVKDSKKEIMSMVDVLMYKFTLNKKEYYSIMR